MFETRSTEPALKDLQELVAEVDKNNKKDDEYSKSKKRKHNKE